MDDEGWLQLIRAFDCVKDFRVAGELELDILRALCPTNEEHENILPSLRDLHVQQSMSIYGPLQDYVESFLAQRRLSGRPVQVHSPKFGSIPTLSAEAVPIRQPTAEEITSAKRWVEEQRRIAFNHSFEGVYGTPVPDSEISVYIPSLERLDMVLGNIERYVHIAFAALRKEEFVRRMFTMMASTKYQLEESKKSNPRYILELYIIREMIQEADNMDEGLRTVLGLKLAS
ncbi:hypothetical protein EDB85DRAFT_2037224 [Lactarius pseudohatsudake]|nr:hypothetical protein EDB85DRAFT_2037224 [Lactarius pseudohatsudake]